MVNTTFTLVRDVLEGAHTTTTPPYNIISL